MTEGRKFPLIIWEYTDECRQMQEEAEERKNKLVQDWKKKHNADYYSISPVEPSSQTSIFTFYINTNGEIYRHRMQREKEWSWKEALEHVLKHGHCGYWTHDNLEQLIEGRGPILELAMWDGGFKTTQKNLQEMGNKNS